MIVPPIIFKGEENKKTLQTVKQVNEELKAETPEFAKPISEESIEIQKVKQEEKRKKEKEEEEQKWIAINLSPLEHEIKKLELEKLKLEEQREWEDKNYDELLLRVENLFKRN